MVDYMLKFDDKQQAETVLLTAGLLQELDGQLVPAYGKAVDVIGTIHKMDGTFTQVGEGFKVPNFTALDGYHVNVRVDGAIESLEPYAVTPATPHRVWA